MSNKVIVITGPTAIGKTDLSFKICELFNGEIINCDASSFKKDLNIGTAKPDLSKTNIVHHMIDIINYNEFYSISDFQKNARMLIDDIIKRGKTPVLTGGSGLYINSVIYDYKFTDTKRDKESFNNLTNEEMHKRLEELDYEASLKIPLNNRKRMQRALELALSDNKISDNICNFDSLYDTRLICLTTERDILYDRINKRVDLMIKNGLIDECKDLINKGYDLQGVTDIGYKEIYSYLKGECTLEDATDEIKKKTRHFAKRQLTWFRNKMNCKFVEMDYDNINNTINKIIEIVK